MTKITSKAGKVRRGQKMAALLRAYSPRKTPRQIAEDGGLNVAYVVNTCRRRAMPMRGDRVTGQLAEDAVPIAECNPPEMRQKGAWPPGMRFQDAEGVR